MTDMTINWSELGVFQMSGEEVNAPWLLALESVGNAAHLKIEAEGSWTSAGGVTLPDCGPDGLAGLSLPDEYLILSGCRLGALIGKLGGSSAAHHVPAEPGAELATGEPFAVGSVCQLKLPEGIIGPLFLGFNARVRPVRVGTLKVKLSGARPTL